MQRREKKIIKIIINEKKNVFYQFNEKRNILLR